MAWIYLLAAGLLEIGWAVALKLSDGFTKPLPVAAVAVGATTSFVLLSASLKTLPAGTAYAVWTGIGIAGVALAGIVFLGERAEPARLLFLGLVFIGIAGLSLTER